MSRVCAGYLDVLELHRRYGVPLSLHLSGTLLEGMLWHQADRFDRIRRLVRGAGFGLVGGTYSEPIMPTLSPAMNRLQLATMAELLTEHFRVDAARVRTAWLPERVWAPELHDAFTDPTLRGGPYDRVLVDDRLLAAERTTLTGPFQWKDRQRPPEYHPGMIELDSLRPRTVLAGGRRLTMVPICSYLRYLFPPRSRRQWDFLRRMLADLAERSDAGEPALLVFADDMERAAGVGGWEPAIAEYERLLDWLAGNEFVELVDLDDWLDRHDFAERGPVPAGSYHELEVDWGAHADFTGWSADPQWLPYAELLTSVETSIATAERRLAWQHGGDDLLVLARRLLMLGQHETAWRDPVDHGPVDAADESGGVDAADESGGADAADESGGAEPQRHLAPWVRATAAHAALARPLVAAAYWAADGGCAPYAELIDIDGDGETELVLADDRTWCVVSPRRGARLTLMCHRDRAGCPVVVGNPADHWNFQEELHRFMDEPAAHPGALTIRDDPHQEWIARPTVYRPEGVVVDLYRPGAGEWSRRYALLFGIPGLVVCLRDMEPGSVVDNLLTPDYLRALTRGERGVPFGGRCYVGRRHENRSSWVGFDPRQAAVTGGARTPAGHGHLVGLSPIGTDAELIIGAGPVSDQQIGTWLARVRTILGIGPRWWPEYRAVVGDPGALAGEVR
jgi:hypothetical protein